MPPCGRVVGIAQDPPLPAIQTIDSTSIYSTYDQIGQISKIGVQRCDDLSSRSRVHRSRVNPGSPFGSTVGPRFLAGIRGSPQKIRQRWVPV